jgi:hypothetical protein
MEPDREKLMPLERRVSRIVPRRLDAQLVHERFSESGKFTIVVHQTQGYWAVLMQTDRVSADPDRYPPGMATRRASCSCGQLTVEVEGDPVRVSICHCLACQRRTGSVFGMQARWPREQVRIEGDATEYVRISDEGGEERSFFFCPRCGATVYYWIDSERIAVPVGAFADPSFPAPRVSVWEERMHPWVGLPDGIEHIG